MTLRRSLHRLALLFALLLLFAACGKKEAEPDPVDPPASPSNPTVALNSGAGSDTNTSPIPVTATFSTSVTGFDVTDVLVSNGTAGNFAGAGSSYSFDITPSGPDVTVQVDVPANAAQAGGMGNVDAAPLVVNYDAVSPGVTVGSAAADPTNGSPIAVNVTFDESVSGFALADVTVGNGTAANLAGSGSTYSFDVTPSGGVVTVSVDIPAGAAQDAAGNTSTAAGTFTIGYDGVRPAVVISTAAPVLQNKTNVSPLPVTVTFAEAVTGFVLADASVGNGTASNFAGSGTTYTFDVTPSGDPVTITVNVAADVATDAAGNTSTAATQFQVGYETGFDPLDLPPSISNITDKVTNQDTPLEFVLFTANEGAGEDAQILSVVSLVSSNLTLVPNANIVLESFTDNGGAPGASGELTITPAAGQTGSATITVTVTDGNSTAQDSFLLTVNAVIDPPVAYNVNAVTNQNVPVGIVLAADDPGGDPIVAWNIDIPPANGTLSGVAPNLTYTPDPGYSGRDSFTYYVTDNTAENSNSAIVTLVVDGSADFIVADPVAVAAGGSIYTGDEQVYAEIQALGFTVNLIDDDDVLLANYTPADTDLVDLVIVSSSVGSANIGGTLSAITTPVMTWERFLYDAASGFGMTGTTDVDDGIFTTTQIRIVNEAHPLAGGLLNGLRTVFAAAQPLVWGSVVPPGEVVADVEVTPGVFQPVLFTYAKGDLMQGGVTAPAKRVAYFLPDVGAGTLTADGITLLHAAINEALAR